jgi:hypothetical protein
MAGTPSDNPEEAHKDLMALIKAGREMTPDMDQALAESYMEKHKPASQGSQHSTAQQAVVPQGDAQFPQVFGYVAPAIGIVFVAAIYIAALTFGGPWLWWLIFPLMGMAFGGWRRYGHGYDERYRLRDERRLARDQWRHERNMARMGYPPERSEPEQLPEPAGKWTPPTPPAQQSTPPAKSSAPTTGNETPPANPAG